MNRNYTKVWSNPDIALPSIGACGSLW